jgi:hypothetical protein
MDIGQLLASLAAQEGVELKVTSEEARDYMAARAASLALLVGDQDYQEALLDARDSVWLYAARHAVDSAKMGDQKVSHFILGALGAASMVIA